MPYKNDCPHCKFVATFRLPSFDEPVDLHACGYCTKKGFLLVHSDKEGDNQSLTGDQLISFMKGVTA